jgi:hypothetical protein
MRHVAAAIVALVVLVLAASGVVVGHHFALRSHHRAAAPQAERFRPPPEGQSTDAVRTQAITNLLAARSQAILQHNRRTFLATLDPGSPSFRKRQLASFANLQPVPFASWSYTLDAATEAPTDGAQFLRYRAPVWLPHVVLHYAVRGFDAAPTALDEYFTFVQRGTRWYVGSDSDDAKLAYESAKDIWDFGPVTVVRGSRAIVLGHPDSSVSLRALVEEADRDIPRVTRVWGSGWSQRVVIMAPDSPTELNKLINDDGDLSQIAAVATAELVEGSHSTRPVGDRVLVNPRNYSRLNAKGRQVVITHEITHVASRSATGPLTPDWLIEGLADYAGYREVNVTPRIAAAELKTYLDAGHRLTGLPSDEAYAGTNKHLDRTYDQSWLACRFIAEHWGQPTLIRLYRAVGAAASGSSATATKAGVRAVLHESLPAFVGQWESYVSSVLQ